MPKSKDRHKSWQKKPGSYDALNTSRLFESNNRYGIPQLRRDSFARIPKWMAPYRQRIKSNQPLEDGACHFFLDDYRFESVWNHPTKALSVFGPYPVVLTPDFSLYRDWPLTIQQWNIYRSRWCGAFWQSQGVSVIPTISWGAASSYDFCFLGVARGSIVAISTVGVRLDKPVEYHLFMLGFAEMVRQINPALVLCYGQAPVTCSDFVKTLCYPTRWSGIRSARHSSDQPGIEEPKLKIPATTHLFDDTLSAQPRLPVWYFPEEMRQQPPEDDHGR
jgi:hypothetical protein